MTDVNGDSVFVLGRWHTYGDGRKVFVAGPVFEIWMDASWFPIPK